MDSVPKSFNPNRRLKEEFVSNLTGSSMLEIAAITTIIPALFLLRRAVGFNRPADDVTLKKNDDAKVGSKSWQAYMARLAVDFLFIMVPFVLIFTVLSEWMYIWATLLILLLVFSIAARSFGFGSTLEEEPDSIRTSITSFRVATMMLTCICILAVDFTIFPRRYAKTETYGTGWMDLGVGSFVVANSFVSRQARNLSWTKWKTAIQSTSPLIILGFVRLLSTAGLDYQHHAAEYGVHWNFFFTLAAISFLTSIINVPARYSGILGALILVGYEGWLMQGLNTYLLSNERGSDIISQNKEGFFSIFGYWSMYLIGVQVGNFLFFSNHSSATTRSHKWTRNRAAMLSLLFWYSLLPRHVVKLMLGMAIVLFSDCFPGSKTSVLEEAYNHNLLAIFLLANLLTGVVNFLVDTLFASSVKALSVMIAYAFTLTFIPGLLDFCGIRFRFW
ncbi:uncharacterized protein At4g17910 isoform X2 [Rosa chinensis]|uniref:uncharacterized protein At4g17910 isoform X2 n=1 Tax=Rosa chinensis TaxID=74649 RepID=UPI001AD8C0A4|nr:uncharacterized protein At4g17910 isoform X2 [Rosa chinensis]